MSVASSAAIASGAAWTIGAYAASVLVRFGSNVILARLVSPEIFGAILVIITLRNGVDLISDVGIGQNVVKNKNGDKPQFLNTAWTLQLIRGLVLFLICIALAGPVAALYHLPEAAIQIGAVTLIVLGAASTSIFTMQRRLELARLNLFDLGQDVIGATAALAFAALSPTLWAILAASLLSTTVRTVSTFLLPAGRNRLLLDRRHAVEILSFGKWIFLWSTLGFLSASLDRLYLGSAASLAVLGVYGIARTMAELPVALAGRLGHSLVFPMISAGGDVSRADLRRRIAGPRLTFLLLTGLGLAGAIASADWVIRILYDARYHAAEWMLPLMLAGAWAGILCTLNEYSLLGLGKPAYGAAANSLKLAYMAVGTPLGFQSLGLLGVILVVGTSELVRYVPLVVGQARERLMFILQDALATMCLLGAVAAFTLLRHALSLGTAFDRVPLP